VSEPFGLMWLLNVLLESGVNVHRLRSCWRRTFWEYAIGLIKMTWRNTVTRMTFWETIVFIAIQLIIYVFLSRRMRYPVGILCSKWSNYDFCTSQSSIVTVLGWSGQNYSHLSISCTPKIIKIGQILRSYSKKK